MVLGAATGCDGDGYRSGLVAGCGRWVWVAMEMGRATVTVVLRCSNVEDGASEGGDGRKGL